LLTFYPLKEDYQEAFKWYKLAADQNNFAAKCGLAAMPAEGNGAKKNMAEAKRLAKEGYEAGNDFCKTVWEQFALEKN
jgi:TPR repeat protein